MSLKLALLGPEAQQQRFKQIRANTRRSAFSLAKNSSDADAAIILLDPNADASFLEQWNTYRATLSPTQNNKPVYAVVCSDEQSAPEAKRVSNFQTDEFKGFLFFKKRVAIKLRWASTEKRIRWVLYDLSEEALPHSQQYKNSRRKPAAYFSAVLGGLLWTSVFLSFFLLPAPANGILGFFLFALSASFGLWGIDRARHANTISYFKKFGISQNSSVPWQWYISQDLRLLSENSAGLGMLAGILVIVMLFTPTGPGELAAMAFVALGFIATAMVSFVASKAAELVKVELPSSDSDVPSAALAENTDITDLEPAPTHKVVSRASQWWSKLKQRTADNDAPEASQEKSDPSGPPV